MLFGQNGTGQFTYDSTIENSQYHQRAERVSKVSKNSFFAMKLVPSCGVSNQQQFILGDEVSTSEPKVCSLLNNLWELLKTLEKASSSPFSTDSFTDKKTLKCCQRYQNTFSVLIVMMTSEDLLLDQNSIVSFCFAKLQKLKIFLQEF